MANKKTAEKIDNEGNVINPKTCFVIMPIADHPDYEPGHFNRVYEYLIKPACIQAGYEPKRADDSKASHMIMFDILKKIMDCDMAICDLSSKNANVFYELGLRQAFNKKTILITDGRDKPPFDIAGFRYVGYSPSLRVDSVKIEIDLIEEMLTETSSAPDDDVNSIVKLLEIKPAHVDTVELDKNDSVIFNMFNQLQNKIENLAEAQSRSLLENESYYRKPGVAVGKSAIMDNLTLHELRELAPERVPIERFNYNGKYVGKLLDYNNGTYRFQTDNGLRYEISGGNNIEKKMFVARKSNI